MRSASAQRGSSGGNPISESVDRDICNDDGFLLRLMVAVRPKVASPDDNERLRGMKSQVEFSPFYEHVAQIDFRLPILDQRTVNSSPVGLPSGLVHEEFKLAISP
jgi:hypothetical protein